MRQLSFLLFGFKRLDDRNAIIVGCMAGSCPTWCFALSKPVDLGSVKEGSYILIEGEPCRLVGYDKSKPGKHGAAKARVVGIGLFDGVKRSLVSPVSSNIEVPIIEKRNAQIISVTGHSVQLMDLETFEYFDAETPKEEDVTAKIQATAEVEYWRVMGRNKIVRVKG